MAEIFKRGVYAILDYDHLAPVIPDAPGDERDMWLAYGAAAVDNGAVALQLRAKSVPAAGLYLARLYRELLQAFGEHVPVLLNDHVDLAGGFGDLQGVGVHVGQRDDGPYRARAVLSDAGVVGLSTHDLMQVAAGARSEADYLGFGPIFSTQSKPDAEPAVGLDGLEAACDATNKPIIAIGGLTMDHVADIKARGAHGMAVLSGWLGPREEPWSPGQAGMTISMMNAIWQASPASSSD